MGWKLFKGGDGKLHLPTEVSQCLEGGTSGGRGTSNRPHILVYTPTSSTSTQPKSMKKIMKNQIQETSEKSKTSQTMNYLPQGFHASLSALLEKEEVLKILEELCSLRLLVSPNKSNHAFYYLKMLKGFYHTTKEKRLLPSLTRWMNWGMTANGKCLTAKISVSHKTENECSLSDILEEQVDQKYFLLERPLRTVLSRIPQYANVCEQTILETVMEPTSKTSKSED